MATLIKKKSDSDDAVKLAQVVAWKTRDSKSVQELLKAMPFQPKTSWFKDMFWLIDSKLEYRYDDPGREQIKTPDYLFQDGAGDCDDFATLWMAILNNVNVKSMPKIVDYESDGYWDHIYVIVPVRGSDYLVLDNVAGKFRRQFNVEVDYKEEKIFRPIKF